MKVWIDAKSRIFVGLKNVPAVREYTDRSTNSMLNWTLALLITIFASCASEALNKHHYYYYYYYYNFCLHLARLGVGRLKFKLADLILQTCAYLEIPILFMTDEIRLISSIPKPLNLAEQKTNQFVRS